VGYPFGKKAWKLYDLEMSEFFESRDVVFYEHIFSSEKQTGAVDSSNDQHEEFGYTQLPGQGKY